MARDLNQLLEHVGELLKLTWLYRHAPPQPEEVESLVAPPQETLQTLSRLAQLGEMRAIREAANQPSTLGDEYKPFANRLHHLAERFESRAISLLIEKYIE